jgi:23S rRNA (cytidine1920-2'-O)/16S rRNA (cytidine1409-2'-O)-methyltransferase
MGSVTRKRLDLLLVEQGLVESRSLAQRLVMAGQVRVDGQVISRPAAPVPDGAHLEIDQGPPFVSRGGEKLAAALRAFSIPVLDRVCADVGASTGGFSDCLLQNGARRVYAIDVGKGILHWKLRQDARVVVMEETNARYVERLPEPVGFVAIDASFISLKLLLPVVEGWLEPEAQLVALVKPQFEAGRAEAARGEGVVRDPAVHRRVLMDVLGFAAELGFAVRGLLRSPLLGPKGNVEFLAWFEWPIPPGFTSPDLPSLVTAALLV